LSQIGGFVMPRFEAVGDAFVAAFHDRPTMGAGLAVRHQGTTVVDLWGGVADERTGAAWGEDTVGVVFSTTKGLVSILAARLVQEGVFGYEDTVASYWPEFAASGKGEVRIADLLAHRSGLSAPRHPVVDLTAWDDITAQLAAQEPLWEPGTGHSYHAMTQGWLVGEVIRRATGQRVGELFQALVADPLCADAWIGLPSALRTRVAHLQTGVSMAELAAQQSAEASPGVPDWNYAALTLHGALPFELVGPDTGFNDPRVQEAEVPAAGGIASARALAAIWSATVVETDGVRLVDDATLERALVPQSEGPQVWPVPGPTCRWAMGFQLDSAARRYLSSLSFGHDGAGGQVAFADPVSGVGFAFVTNYMEAGDDSRATSIIDALREVLAT
jgi:CubicO group peptidase (beta-lactamase class C family)